MHDFRAVAAIPAAQPEYPPALPGASCASFTWTCAAKMLAVGPRMDAWMPKFMLTRHQTTALSHRLGCCAAATSAGGSG
jgi:hypothetical protein